MSGESDYGRYSGFGDFGDGDGYNPDLEEGVVLLPDGTGSPRCSDNDITI